MALLNLYNLHFKFLNSNFFSPTKYFASNISKKFQHWFSVPSFFLVYSVLSGPVLFVVVIWRKFKEDFRNIKLNLKGLLINKLNLNIYSCAIKCIYC